MKKVRRLVRIYRLGTPMVVTFFLMLQVNKGQTCTGNPNVGCTHAGATCGPVTTGNGPVGKCTTPNGFPKGERSCECVGTPPPPPPDRRCADRTAKGTIVCVIAQPDVSKRITGYSSVVFEVGDRVLVSANGCVQTGGAKPSWKRYVNPSGPKSDRLYHGLILIPTATARTMVAIGTIINRYQVVTHVAGLQLGYEDDTYADNGYYDHDDGIGSQCKTDGGPARVTITINR